MTQAGRVPLSMVGARPMTCPQCSGTLRIQELHAGRCPACGIAICASRGFHWKVRIAFAPIAAALVYAIIMIPYKMHSLFLYVLLVGFLLIMEWYLLVALYLFAFLLSPPYIERDVGDPIRLNLK